MSYIKENSNNTNLTRYYDIIQAKNREEALAWICSIRGVPGITTNYLYLSDLINRSDEGSNSIQIDGDAEFSEVLEEFRKRSIDSILLNGNYNGKPVVIGADLRTHLIFVTVRKKLSADYLSLEQALNLTIV